MPPRIGSTNAAIAYPQHEEHRDLDARTSVTWCNAPPTPSPPAHGHRNVGDVHSGLLNGGNSELHGHPSAPWPRRRSGSSAPSRDPRWTPFATDRRSPCRSTPMRSSAAPPVDSPGHTAPGASDGVDDDVSILGEQPSRGIRVLAEARRRSSERPATHTSLPATTETGIASGGLRRSPRCRFSGARRRQPGCWSLTEDAAALGARSPIAGSCAQEIENVVVYLNQMYLERVWPGEYSAALPTIALVLIGTGIGDLLPNGVHRGSREGADDPDLRRGGGALMGWL